MELKNISDTALWVTTFRANETTRPNAHFLDPLAAKLAGPRGKEIAQQMAGHSSAEWAIVTRTVLIDQMILEEIERGSDTILNLAAGLDTRPYRMKLPPGLNWIEVDLPDLLDYKEKILADEKPVCKLTRHRIDLSNGEARRNLFKQIGENSKRCAVITEGLLIYLTPENVTQLSRDLCNIQSFQTWILELASLPLMKMLMKGKIGESLISANAEFKFAPTEGIEFFKSLGWKPIRVESLVKTAAKLKRLSLWMRIAALFPETELSRKTRPWSGICLMEKI